MAGSTSAWLTSTRKVAALAAAPFLLLVAACGDDSDGDGEAVAPQDFAVTPEYLHGVAERSTAEPFRYELWVSTLEADTDRPPLLTGVRDEDRFSLEMDMAEYMSLTYLFHFEAIGRELTQSQVDTQVDLLMRLLEDDDAIVKVTGDASSMYLQVPDLRRLDSPELTYDPGPDELADLGPDDWAYVDLTAVTDEELGDIQDGFGELIHDPRALMDVIAEADGARELEPIVLGGEELAGITAEVPTGELQAALGEVPDPAVADVAVPVDVWVDRDGYLRRIHFSVELTETMPGTVETLVDGVELEGPSFTPPAFELILDISDHGEPVDIELPTDFVDITDAE